MATGITKSTTVVGIAEEAAAATGTIQVINDTFDGAETLVVNGVTFTEGSDFTTGSGISTTAAAIATAINASNNFLINGVLRAEAVTDTVTLTADIPGIAGNSLTLVEGNVGATDNMTIVSFSSLATGVSTEGTAKAPQSATDFLEVLQDGLEMTPAKELVERNILSSSIGKLKPRVSVKSATGSLPVELKASGSEGGIPQWDVPMRALFGSRRRLNNRVTTGSSHSTTSLVVSSADTIFKVGDMFVILETNAHHTAFVTSVSSGAIGYAPAPSAGAPSDSVVLSKSVTYFLTNSAHPHFTSSIYWANTIREQTIGTLSASKSLENFTTGQIASFNFSTDALTFTEADGAAPFTPSFDSGQPPVIQSIKFFQGTTCLDINEFGLSFENTVSNQTSVKSANGRIASRVSSRTISGTFNPFKDDTTITQFTNFNANTSFSILVTGQNASSTSGEFELGSCFGIFLPDCLLTEKVVGDTDGILVENLSFSANRGSDGTTEEIFLGVV